MSHNDSVHDHLSSPAGKECYEQKRPADAAGCSSECSGPIGFRHQVIPDGAIGAFASRLFVEPLSTLVSTRRKLLMMAERSLTR